MYFILFYQLFLLLRICEIKNKVQKTKNKVKKRKEKKTMFDNLFEVLTI